MRKYLRAESVEPPFHVPERPSKLDPYADELAAMLRIELGGKRPHAIFVNAQRRAAGTALTRFKVFQIKKAHDRLSPQSSSSASAMPWPPPMQSVTMPFDSPSRFIE